MPIKVGKPIYLKGLYYNIPLKETWNASLLAGLNAISKEVRDAKISVDIHEIMIDQLDEMAEVGARGSIGYAIPAPKGTVTDYYYIDFVVSDPAGKDEYWYEDTQYFKELTDGLADYLDGVHGFVLKNCKYDTQVNDEGYMVLALRAYFVKTAKKFS